MNARFYALCGMVAPWLFIFMTILGGAIRPGYSHLTNTISELMSPGSPNKLLMDMLYTTFAILLILFGVGIVKFVRQTKTNRRIGTAGGILFIAVGCLSLLAATLYPQDPWGSTPTFAGEMHIRLEGIIGLLSLGYILLTGIWFIRTGISTRFGIYSFITIALALVASASFMVGAGGPLMGLWERAAALIGFQWTFVLALWMFLHSAPARAAPGSRMG